jgi:hypothetical protein
LQFWCICPFQSRAGLHVPTIRPRRPDVSAETWPPLPRAG